MSKFEGLRYFTREEFDSPDVISSGEAMDLTLLKRLDRMRGEAGFSFYVTSGFRTKEHNARVGGVHSSSHTKGLAVDIACTNNRQRAIIIKLALKYGFTRIGISKGFIHLDIDESKSENVIWLY